MGSETDEGAALVAVMEADEDEALRIIRSLAPGRRQLLALYAERLSTLANDCVDESQ
jgi:hypothetical protein